MRRATNHENTLGNQKLPVAPLVNRVENETAVGLHPCVQSTLARWASTYCLTASPGLGRREGGGRRKEGSRQEKISKYFGLFRGMAGKLEGLKDADGFMGCSGRVSRA